MRCRNGHDHSVSPVMVSTYNPVRRGRRPFHCPDCREANKEDHQPSYWVTYPNPEAAREEIPHTWPCKICF